MVEALKLQFIGLLSDGRSGLCVTLIRLPPQELVGTFPRGEGKIFMFFCYPKTYMYQYVFGFRRTRDILRKPSLVREGVLRASSARRRDG